MDQSHTCFCVISAHSFDMIMIFQDIIQFFSIFYVKHWFGFKIGAKDQSFIRSTKRLKL